MNKIKTLFLATLCLFPVYGIGSTEAGPCENLSHKTNASLFNFLKQQTPMSQGIFKQTKKMAEYNVKLISSGNFKITGNNLKWITTKPQQSQVDITTNYIRTKTGDDINEIPLASNSYGAILSETLFALFQLKFNKLQHAFNIDANQIDQQWLIRLRPCDSLTQEISSVDTPGLFWPFF